VPHSASKDEPAGPVDVRFPGPEGQLFEAEHLAALIEKTELGVGNKTSDRPAWESGGWFRLAAQCPAKQQYCKFAMPAKKSLP